MLVPYNLFSTSLSSMASYFTLPSIGTLYYNKGDVGEYFSAIAGEIKAIRTALDALQIGIPIYPDKYEEKGGNEIGQQILVSAIGSDQADQDDVTGSLVRVADNIVCDPKSWVIHGYVGIKEDDPLTSFLLKMVPFMNIVSAFGRPILLEVFRMTLRYICDARRPFKFNTADGDTIPALIKSYSVKKAAENDNWLELDIEIQEFRYIAMVDGKDQDQRAGGFKAGIDGKTAAQKLGRTALKKLFL